MQTRWGHLNRDYSLLTKAQSVLLDGHFVVEQAARHSNGLFLNFNGTAGVIRKKCIEQSGGWQHDTLTEDLDLSYRAQINGWRAVYLPDVISDAELPVDMNAFKIQQHRWVKGGIQTAGKLLPSVLGDPRIPFKVKAESVFHLLGNFSYLFLLATIILIIPMNFLWERIWLNDLFIASVTGVALGTFAIIRFYILTVREAHGSQAREFYKYIPVALSVGAGIGVNNAKAVLEAVLGRTSGFARTPKYAVVGRKGQVENLGVRFLKRGYHFFRGHPLGFLHGPGGVRSLHGIFHLDSLPAANAVRVHVHRFSLDISRLLSGLRLDDLE